MPSPDNRFQVLAREAAQRIDAARAAGEQLRLLPDDPAEALEPGKGRGRARAGKGFGAWLAAQGYRDPGAVLAEIAGLDRPEDAVVAAMIEAERVCLWAGVSDGKHRLAVFAQLYAAKLRALDALMPYAHAKAEAPAAPPPAVHVHVTQAPGRPGDGARLVNPGPDLALSGAMFAPPPMPEEIEQKQGDAE
jgi:hypothetical protein